MYLESKEDVGVQEYVTIQQDHRILDMKWCVKCIKVIWLGGKFSTGKIRNGPSSSEAIQKVDYECRQIYSNGKPPTIKIFSWNYKSGKNRKHAGILRPIKTSICGHKIWWKSGGLFGRYWHKYHKIGCSLGLWWWGRLVKITRICMDKPECRKVDIINHYSI